jgi:hypothetical protein
MHDPKDEKIKELERRVRFWKSWKWVVAILIAALLAFLWLNGYRPT